YWTRFSSSVTFEVSIWPILVDTAAGMGVGFDTGARFRRTGCSTGTRDRRGSHDGKAGKAAGGGCRPGAGAQGEAAAGGVGRDGCRHDTGGGTGAAEDAARPVSAAAVHRHSREAEECGGTAEPVCEGTGW